MGDIELPALFRGEPLTKREKQLVEFCLMECHKISYEVMSEAMVKEGIQTSLPFYCGMISGRIWTLKQEMIGGTGT